MKFEIIYSRKIRDAVAVFTIFMFICQYGLTREDVAENFSRTAPTWGWFAFYAVMSFLLIFWYGMMTIFYRKTELYAEG